MDIRFFDKAIGNRPFSKEFWEVWILALVFVLVLGFATRSETPKTGVLHSQVDHYDIRPEATAVDGKRIETGM